MTINNKKNPFYDNDNNDNKNKKDIFKYINDDNVFKRADIDTTILFNRDKSVEFDKLIRKISDPCHFGVAFTPNCISAAIQTIMENLSPHILNDLDANDFENIKLTLAGKFIARNPEQNVDLINLLIFLWNLRLIDENSEPKNLNKVNKKCRQILLNNQQMLLISDESNNQFPAANPSNGGAKPDDPGNNQEVFLGKYQYGADKFFKAYGISAPNGQRTFTKIILPDNITVKLNSSGDTNFTYDNVSFIFNAANRTVYNSDGFHLTFHQNNAPLVQSSNNAQGYGQGRASEADKCIDDFYQLNNEGKINVEQHEIKLENNPKYIFKIEKQAQCSENLRQALEKAGIDKEKLSTLNDDCYAIYAYEIKDGKADENNKRLVYEGQIKDGKLSGLGQLFLLKGNDDEEYYAGEFKDGKYDGKGFYQYSKHIYGKEKGDSYKGEFKDGKKHGKGVYNYSNGLSIDEEWSNGVRYSEGIKDHSKGSDMQADVFVFDFANSVSTGYNAQRYATVGRIVSKEVVNSKYSNSKEDFKALNEEHEEDEAENEDKWKKKINAFIENAKKSNSKVLKIVLSVHGSKGSYLWLNDNHWDGQSFEYLLEKINETPELKDKNIEIINGSCHQSQKFLFEEIQDYISKMSEYCSMISEFVKPHITLPKDIDKKIEQLEGNKNKKELFDTLRAGETFKQELLNSTYNTLSCMNMIIEAENLKDLYDKIFPAKNVTVQVDSGKKIGIATLNSNGGTESGRILMPILGNLLGANDQQPLSEDERIRQNTAKCILLQLDDDSMLKMFGDFHDFFKEVINNENNKHQDIYDKCKDKKGEELFNVVFEAFTDEKRKKIINDKSIREEDVKEVESVFYRISPTKQRALNTEMNSEIVKDVKKIDDVLHTIIQQHDELVKKLTKKIVDKPNEIDEKTFNEEKNRILDLKQTIFTTINDFFYKEDNFDNITKFLEKYKNDEKINLPTKAEFIEAMKEQIASYNEKITTKFNGTEKILDYVFKYKRIYKQNYITDFVKDFATKHCKNNNQAEVIYSEDINPDDVHYTIKRQKDHNNPLSVSNQQILLEYKKFNKENGKFENILADEDKEKYDEQKKKFLERVKQHQEVQSEDNPKETKGYHDARDIHNESLNMLEIKNRSKRIKNELLYGKEIMAKISEESRTVSMMEDEKNEIKEKEKNSENKQATFGGQKIISAQTNQKISIPEFTESEVGETKQSINDSYTTFLGNSQGKDGEKQSLFFTQTEDQGFVLTYIEEDKNGQKNYWTYNCNKNETIALMNDGKLRIHDHQGFLRPLQLFPADGNTDKLKIDFQHVSGECLEKFTTHLTENSMNIDSFCRLTYLMDKKQCWRFNIRTSRRRELQYLQLTLTEDGQTARTHAFILDTKNRKIIYNDQPVQIKYQKRKNCKTGEIFIIKNNEKNERYRLSKQAQESIEDYFIEEDNEKIKKGEEINIDITKLERMHAKKEERQEFKLLESPEDKEKKLKFLSHDPYEETCIHLNNDEILIENEPVTLTYQKTGEKGKIIAKYKNDNTTINYTLDEESQTLIESCFSEQEKQQFNVVEKIFEKKEEEKEFKLRCCDNLSNQKGLELSNIGSSGDDFDLGQHDFYLRDDQICVWNCPVTLTYQKVGKKGKIIAKYENDNTTINYTLDEESQTLIESCFSEQEKQQFNVVNATKFEKIFEKKREENKFKLYGFYYDQKILQLASVSSMENIKFTLNNDNIVIVGSHGKNPLQLTYQQIDGKGKIIMKNSDQNISYPLDEEAQKIIEKCLSEEEKKKLQQGVVIDAEKFEKIFEKTREDPFEAKENKITINNTPSNQTSMTDVAQLNNSKQNEMMQEMDNNTENTAIQQQMQKHEANNNGIKNKEMNKNEQKNYKNDLFNKKNENINNSNKLEQNLSSSAIIVKS